MNDNEIIKALECCLLRGDCTECPYYRCDNGKCLETAGKQALDLINRLQGDNERLEIELKAMRGAANTYKAEIEKLERDLAFAETISRARHNKIEKLSGKVVDHMAEIEREDKILNSYALQYGTVKDQSKRIEEIKSEAIKEFAVRLKDVIYQDNELYKSCAKGMLSADYQRGYEEKNDNIIRLIDYLLAEMDGKERENA